MPQTPPAPTDEFLQALRPLDAALFRARQIFLYGEINQSVARAVTERLIAMAAEGSEPITLFICSQGGHVEAGDTIHDMLNFVQPRVRVVGTGWVASAGAHVFIARPRADRFCLPNTRFMLHQPRGGVFGQAMDIGIEAQEIVKMRRRLNRTIAEQTGQPLERVEKDTDRNYWMSAEEAVEYGLVGQIIRSQRDL